MNPLTAWVLRLKGNRNNSQFARDLRIHEATVRDLICQDTVKVYTAETLGRLLELDPDPDLRGERIVIAYLRSLARLPRRQYTNKRSTLKVAADDLSDFSSLELENE